MRWVQTLLDQKTACGASSCIMAWRTSGIGGPP
jgi:hypothetical protein